VQNMIQWRTVAGSPVAAGDATITPLSKVLAVRLPFGGFVLHRPYVVRVERRGSVERIPVRDVTRILQIGLLLASALLISGRIRLFKRKES
jgi:hypothetical protein